MSKAFHKLGNWVRANWRSIVTIVVVAVLTWGLGAFAALGPVSTGAISGGVSGGLNAGLNGGDFSDILRGTLVQGAQGAISAGFLHPLGEAAQSAGTFSAETAIHVAGHGVLGGADNAALGGKFQDGFLSAAASTFAGDAGLLGGEGGGAVGIASRTIRASIVGGSASALGGGKFANGAYTAAFQHLLNEEYSEDNQTGKTRRDGLAEIELENRYFNRKQQEFLSDGKLSLEEAEWWYRSDRGGSLTVDATKLTVERYSNDIVESRGSSYDTINVRTYGYKYSTLHGRTIIGGDDYYVHGQVTYNQRSGKISDGLFDFEMHRGYASQTIIRNIATLGGNLHAGAGTPFNISYYGKPKYVYYK